MDKLSSWTLYRQNGDNSLFTRTGHQVAAPSTVGFTRKEASPTSLPADQVTRYNVRYSIGHVNGDGVPLRAKDAINLEISKAVAADSTKLFTALAELASYIASPAFLAMVATTLTLPRDVDAS